MRKEMIYNLARQLNLSKYETDNILKTRKNSLRKSITTANLYKSGTHYGTISIKDFFI